MTWMHQKTRNQHKRIRTKNSQRWQELLRAPPKNTQQLSLVMWRFSDSATSPTRSLTLKICCKSMKVGFRTVSTCGSTGTISVSASTSMMYLLRAPLFSLRRKTRSSMRTLYLFMACHQGAPANSETLRCATENASPKKTKISKIWVVHSTESQCLPFRWLWASLQS